MKEKNISCALFLKNNETVECLNNLLSNFKTIKSTITIRNLLDASEVLTNQKISILFIDIQSQDVLQLVQKPDFIIGIGCKKDNKNLKKLLNLGFFDFLFEPINESELYTVMSKILKIISSYSNMQNDIQTTVEEYPNSYNTWNNTMHTNSNIIFIEGNRNYERHKMDSEEIVYLKKVNNNVHVHQSNLTTKVFPKTIKYFQNILPDPYFQKIEKSIIVNIRKISEVTRDWRIVVENNIFEVKRSYRKMLKEKMKNFPSKR